MAFCREIRFDRMGAFAYSPEEDTAAAAMPDQIPEEVKQHRLDRLMQQQAAISREENEKRVGSVCRALVTGRRGGMYTARTQWEAPDADGIILIGTDRRLNIGDFAQVRITSADTYDLKAELCEERL